MVSSSLAASCIYVITRTYFEMAAVAITVDHAFDALRDVDLLRRVLPKPGETDRRSVYIRRARWIAANKPLKSYASDQHNVDAAARGTPAVE